MYSSLDRSLFTSFTCPDINKALALMKLNTIFKILPGLKSSLKLLKVISLCKFYVSGCTCIGWTCIYTIYIYIYSSIHPDPSCIQLLENLLAAVSLLKFETPLLKIYLSKYKLCLNCSAFGYKSRVFTLVYH